MRRKKYRKGRQIESLGELVSFLDAGMWVYLRNTPKHPQILMNMSLFTLKLFLREPSSLFIADRNTEGDVIDAECVEDEP